MYARTVGGIRREVPVRQAAQRSSSTDPTVDSGVRVVAEHVSRRFRGTGQDQIIGLDDVSIALEGGATVAVTGPSGSGKSTLLHCLGAIERPDAGRIVVDDQDVTAMSRSQLATYRRRVGFVFQRFHLIPAMTALDNVMAPVLPYRTPFDKRDRARGLLEAVGLAGRENSLPSRLSGGQQQRVAIARALVNRPALLLADEPTGNLDSHTGAEILDLLLDLRGRYGMTVLVATHDPQIAVRCDRYLRLNDGRVSDDVTLDQGVEPATLLARIDRPVIG
jgi:putative ABC transport system ATP-binding protein